MMEKLKQAQKRKALEKLTQSEQFEAALTILTTIERELVDRADRQHELMELDGLDEIPEPEDRIEQLRQICLAKAEGRVPEWWVRNAAPIDNADEAAECADLSAEEWQATKDSWADRYRSMDVEGSVDELAEAHVRRRHDVPLSRFRALVVEWDDDREEEAVQQAVTAGVDTALEGFDRAIEEIEELTDGPEAG